MGVGERKQDKQLEHRTTHAELPRRRRPFAGRRRRDKQLEHRTTHAVFLRRRRPLRVGGEGTSNWSIALLKSHSSKD